MIFGIKSNFEAHFTAANYTLSVLVHSIDFNLSFYHLELYNNKLHVIQDKNEIKIFGCHPIDEIFCKMNHK